MRGSDLSSSLCDRDAAELRLEHRHRGEQALVQVEPLVRGAVHLRVLLGGVDQRRDPLRGVDDLAEQALGLHRVGQPAQRALQRAVRACGVDGLEVVHAEPARDEDRGELPALPDVVVVEPVGELVLGVRGLQRREVRRVAGLLDELVLGEDELLELGAVHRPVGDHRQLVPHAGDAVAQVVRGAPGGRGRVVQLVGEAGGELAQREQPLPLADHRRGVLLPQEQPLQQVHRHRVPGAEHPLELAGPQREEGRVGGGADGGAVELVGLVADVELHGSDVRAAEVGAVDLHLLGADPPRHHDRAGQQHVEALGGVALGDQLVPGRHGDDVAVLADPGQLLVVEVLEEEQAAQLVGRDAAHGIGGVGFGQGHGSSSCRHAGPVRAGGDSHSLVIERRPLAREPSASRLEHGVDQPHPLGVAPVGVRRVAARPDALRPAAVLPEVPVGLLPDAA